MRQKKNEDKNRGNGSLQLFRSPGSLAYMNITLVPWKMGNSDRNKRPLFARCFGKSSHTYLPQFKEEA